MTPAYRQPKKPSMKSKPAGYMSSARSPWAHRSWSTDAIARARSWRLRYVSEASLASPSTRNRKATVSGRDFECASSAAITLATGRPRGADAALGMR